jgi:hypothetical protein
VAVGGGASGCGWRGEWLWAAGERLRAAGRRRTRSGLGRFNSDWGKIDVRGPTLSVTAFSAVLSRRRRSCTKWSKLWISRPKLSINKKGV